MNLFYGTTFEEHVTAFKKDLREIAKHYSYDFGRKKIYIALGQPEHIGKCLLVIGPPIGVEQPFKDKYSDFLLQTASEFGITNVILSSCFLVPIERVSKNDIKNCQYLTEQLVEIFRPKLIVVLGENAQFAFVKRKFILRDYHGQIITTSNTGIDIILSYTMDYFLEKSEYEDPNYKEFIRNSDWTIISKIYKEKVDCN